jgi:hypothetical protein
MHSHRQRKHFSVVDNNSSVLSNAQAAIDSSCSAHSMLVCSKTGLASVGESPLRISSHMSRVHSVRLKAYSTPMLDAIGFVRLEVDCGSRYLPSLGDTVLLES